MRRRGQTRRVRQNLYMEAAADAANVGDGVRPLRKIRQTRKNRLHANLIPQRKPRKRPAFDQRRCCRIRLLGCKIVRVNPCAVRCGLLLCLVAPQRQYQRLFRVQSALCAIQHDDVMKSAVQQRLHRIKHPCSRSLTIFLPIITRNRFFRKQNGNFPVMHRKVPVGIMRPVSPSCL